MTKFAPFTVLASIALALPVAAQAPPSPEQLLLAARRAKELGDLQQAEACYRRATLGFWKAGQKLYAVNAALGVLTVCDPRKNSAKSWAEVSKDVTIGLKFAREAGEPEPEALLLLWRVNVLRPDVGGQGTWAQAREAVDQALAVADRLAAGKTQETVLMTAAELHMPLPGRGGSWERAFSLHRRAADLAQQQNAPFRRAQHLFLMGLCAMPGNLPRGDLAHARSFYAASEALYRQANEPGEAADSALTLAFTYMPPHDPNPDAEGLAKARAAVLRAAKTFEAAGQREKLGRALHVLASCSEPGRDPEGSWAEAARLYGRSAELLSAAGLTDKAQAARANEARCARLATPPAARTPVAASRR